MPENLNPTCELCAQPGGTRLWQASDCRIILVDDPAYPGFCRLIWQEHVREMSDLPAEARLRVWQIIHAVETVVRTLYQPDKINLASFGNMVPHLHWHIIPRWRDDKHFPEPIWGKVQRDSWPARTTVSQQQLQAALAEALAAFAD